MTVLSQLTASSPLSDSSFNVFDNEAPAEKRGMFSVQSEENSGERSLCSGIPLDRSMHSDRPTSPPSVLDLDWELVAGLEEIQLSALTSLATRGISWKNDTDGRTVQLTLHFGGEVDSDGNCLFTSMNKILDNSLGSVPQSRKSVVDYFLVEYSSKSVEEKFQIDQKIQNFYCPDVERGWGVHIVQEFKLLAKKSERESLERAIDDLVSCGLSRYDSIRFSVVRLFIVQEIPFFREIAAETVYKEQCEWVKDGISWGKYMSISGRTEDDYDLIVLHYTEEGLIFVEENRDGTRAAFGDDIVLETLASQFSRDIFVVQAHGSDAMISPDSSVFFLPHKPKGGAKFLPLFLFMKGTG